LRASPSEALDRLDASADAAPKNLDPKGIVVKKSFLAGSTAAVALLVGTGAFADVTPEQVWENWQAMTTAAGHTVSTTDVSRDGDTLVVSGLTLELTNDRTTVSGAIDHIDFTDMGDGTVKVTMADSFPMLIKEKPPLGVEAGKPLDLKLTINQPGSEIIASGTPDALNYAITSKTIEAKLESVNTPESKPVDLNVTATLANVVATYLIEGPADAKKLASSFTADTLNIVASGTDSDTKGDFNVTAALDGISGQSSGTLVDTTDMAQALRDGFAINSTIAYTASKFDFASNTPEGKPTKMTGTSKGGDLSVEMNQDRLKYAANANAAALSLTSADIPLPSIDVSYDEAAFNLEMPLAKSETPADFAFLTRLVGLTVSEPVWAMIDPTGALPHDGATLIIDAKGKATVQSDIFANMEDDMSTPPSGELNALDLSELRFSIAGAELTGNGALTFDNTDMTTFSGMPLPTGKVDLKLTGANTLLDKIVEMGYLSQDDVMGYKMMAGMFTNSAPDKDELTSTLEFKDKGFYANGQKLQ
jgi:hypothetical protein